MMALAKRLLPGMRLGPAAAEPAPERWRSEQWFRVAALKPALDAGVRIERSVVRGQVWQHLTRADGERSFRLNRSAWRLVGACTGAQRLQTLWDQACADLGENAPSQDEALALLLQLHDAGLLSFDARPDFGAQHPGGALAPEAGLAGLSGLAGLGAPAAAAEGARASARADGRSLWDWRLPLGRPDAWLQRTAARLGGLFGAPVVALWLAAMAWMGWVLLAEPAMLADALDPAQATPRRLALAALAAPLLKLLHELGHGLVARHHGVVVRQWGISLMLGLPVPYVDAAAAAALPRRRARMAVAAAGVMVEGAVAAAALAWALAMPAGAAREAPMTVVALVLLASLGVNLNPLLRFDGYHLLTDALGLPNLASRSRGWWLAGLGHRLLGLAADARAPQPAAGEAPWLWVYAPAALVMRLTVATAAVWWLGSISPVLGSALAGLLAWQLLLRPAWALLRWLRLPAQSRRVRQRARRRAALALALVGLPVLALPLPDATVAAGVLWLPEEALLRNEVAGVVEQLAVDDGQAVEAGQALLTLSAPDLDAERALHLGRMEALQTERLAHLHDDPGRAAQALHGWAAEQAALQQVQARLDQLTLRAPRAGRIALQRPQDLPGQHLARGSLVGHLITDGEAEVQLALPHQHAARIAGWQGRVQVRRPAAEGAAGVLQGQWLGQASGAGARLPHPALADRHGGEVATDPADTEARTPREPVLVGRVRLPLPPGARLGERVQVRFDHGRAPLAWQMLRGLQQRVLARFRAAA